MVPLTSSAILQDERLDRRLYPPPHPKLNKEKSNTLRRPQSSTSPTESRCIEYTQRCTDTTARNLACRIPWPTWSWSAHGISTHSQRKTVNLDKQAKTSAKRGRSSSTLWTWNNNVASSPVPRRQQKLEGSWNEGTSHLGYHRRLPRYNVSKVKVYSSSPAPHFPSGCIPLLSIKCV